jgi:membrane fusion protein, heavy metal efflux system
MLGYGRLCRFGAHPRVWALLQLAAVGTACSKAGSDPPKSSPPNVVALDSTAIEMPNPERFPLVEVTSRGVADRLHLTGVVAADVNRSVPVLSFGAGRVVDIRVRLGDDVRRGQLLVRIESPDLAAASAEYRKARADAALAQKQLVRAESLYAHGVIALKDLEDSRNTADKADADLRTTGDRVHVLGATLDHASPILDVRAPIAGTIVEQNVTGGTAVKSLDNSPSLFTIADLSHVWVLCDVYEDDLARVRVGDVAEVQLNAYPGHTFQGRVSNISRVLDQSTRTAKVRIELDNPRGIMRAGMFVTALVQSPEPVEHLVLPTSAVLRLHDRDWVFRRIEANRFRRTEVQTGAQVGDTLQQVLAGVHAHDSVVANALQFASASGTQ